MLPATDKNLRSFGFILAALLAASAGALLWKSGGPRAGAMAAGMLALAAVIAALALRAPRWLIPIFKPWMACAHLAGMAMTVIILTLFFFTFLIPFTLIRLRDPLRMRLGGSSYWETHRRAASTLERFRRAF